MKEKKTTKLVCNVTGKVLLASKDYYSKKVEKAGTEEALHSLYVCRDAKKLLMKGYSPSDAQAMLNITNVECKLTDDQIQQIVGSNASLRLNTNEHTTVGIIKTDPEVQKLINSILAENE